MRKAGKPIVDVQNDSDTSKFSKFNCINFITVIKFVDTASEKQRRLDKKLFEAFLNVVSIYIDFKNKEKYEKLKKLRQAQQELPVAKYRHEIVSAVQNEKVVVIAGDTGCGKSTQVPQYLHEAGFQNIACTQPRRIACVSLSKRVAYEMLTQFESKVGYQIRFEKSKTSDTKICFITEGLLLRQLSSENLPSYDVIILDEIHERHLMGDFLLVPGRLYSIELNYKPILVDDKPTRDDRLDPQPYIQIMQLINSKYPSDERGDLLIFMSGVQEITTICDAAQQYAEKSKNWIVLPLHSALSLAEQDKVFDYPPEGVRKCIVSTNIAETS
ncbi:probable ATP-dependent RNA helicase DHX34, partial [Manduca sexta]|uniref:probable ATP-dependent RNA helicase DHX34 n=1 Tax=Manduca sexta TaxID=7130 RepID=UPI00188F1F4C